MRAALSTVLFLVVCAGVIGGVLAAPVLLIPAGLLLMVLGVLMLLGTLTPASDRVQVGPWCILIGLAIAGVGLEVQRPGGYWSVLAFPACAFLTAITAYQTFAGGWSVRMMRESDRFPDFLARPMTLLLSLMLLVATLWSLGFSELE